MSDWAKDLLADVARELQVDGTGHWMDGEGEELGTNDSMVQRDFLAVLERRLLGLLLGGELANEAVLKGLRYFKGNQEDAILTIAEDGSTLTDFQVSAKAAKLQWDAAKAKASQP